MASHISSREFNQDTSRAKKAAVDGPVFITDRGKPAHVLLSFVDYQKLLGVDLLDRLGEPAGVEDVELVIEPSRELPEAAGFA
ncbi:MAG: type II toxin-antitoxin system Phd/YefM family antitoxin [Actinomycetota bacterium]|nr:type II toxin-antitoxin system Phd/YefM family antitoxin [Actinomycetota bacterium]